MRNFIFFMLVILLTIAGCTKKSVPTVAKETTTVAKEDLKAGADLYSGNCARCHGATGIEGRAPNLSQTEASKAEVIETITKGQGRMPAFANKLSEKEIAFVANFVASLKK